MRKIGGILLCLVLLGSILFTGCSNQTQGAVSVQSVQLLAGFGALGAIDRYAGIVEAGETVRIDKNADMEIAEVRVKAGDKVAEGQVLFVYNTDAIALSLEKQKLELEQLKNSIVTKTEQMEALKKEQASASSSQQLDYTIQIQELQVDISEASYNISAKEKDIEQTQSTLENAEVTAPFEGTVQEIHESGTDDYGNPLPYMTVAQTGAYRVKGTINELNQQSLSEGVAVIIRSRSEERLWSGSISFIDWDNPDSGNSGNNYVYYEKAMTGDSDITASSNYPFYVTLESDEGLMLGQHVTIEADLGQLSPQGLALSASYIMDAAENPWVWAANGHSKLEKRSITLGAYDAALDTYVVTGGLALTDYIAFPEGNCAVGAEVTYVDADSFGGQGDETPPTEQPEGGEPVIGGEEPIIEGGEPLTNNGISVETTAIIDSGNGGDVG